MSENASIVPCNYFGKNLNDALILGKYDIESTVASFDFKKIYKGYNSA